MSEHDEQVTLFQLVELDFKQWPELELLYAVPNAGAGVQRGQAGKMKAEGQKEGVPDVVLPVARGSYHGLYIEMKDGQNGPSPKQQWWLDRLKAEGYYTTVAHSCNIAHQILKTYIQWPPTRIMSEKVWQLHQRGDYILREGR